VGAGASRGECNQVLRKSIEFGQAHTGAHCFHRPGGTWIPDRSNIMDAVSVDSYKKHFPHATTFDINDLGDLDAVFDIAIVNGKDFSQIYYSGNGHLYPVRTVNMENKIHADAVIDAWASKPNVAVQYI
jgi:hypothetical protein